MNFGLIPWYWKLAATALVLIALFGAEQAYESHLIAKGDLAGYTRAKGERAREEAKIKADAELAAGAETKRARAQTAAVQLKFDQLGDSQQKERIDYEISKNIAVAAALAGTERLSIPAAARSGGALSETGAPKVTEAGACAAPETRADILPVAAAALLRFAGDYGQLVRDFNDVVDRYEIARLSCNAD